MLKQETLVPVSDDNKEEMFNDTYEPIQLDAFVKNLKDSIDKENAEDRLKRYRKWAKNRAFYRGNQRGFWDSKKRTWVSVDIDSLSPSEQSVLVVNNQFRPQIKTLSKEFSRSQSRVRCGAMSDSQRSVLASRFGDALIKYYQPKLLPESKRQIRAKFLMLCGNVFLYTRYDQNKKSATVSKKKTGQVTLPGYSASICRECSEEYTAPQETCDKCGGQVENTKVDSQQRPGVLGYDKVNAGDPDTEIVDPAEVDVWGGAMCLDESPYLKRKRIVRKEFIKRAFPYYTPSNESKLSDAAAYQWQFLDIADKTDTTKNQTGLFEYDQIWIDVEMYSGKVLEKEISFKVKKGNKWITKTLPAGAVIENEFPDGMCVQIVGDDILGYYNENKKKCWLHQPFDQNVDGFWADGMEDAVMNQQIVNEYTSLSVENVLYNASPKLLINPALINPVTVTGRPKDILLMSDNARQDSEPSKAFAQLTGMSLTQEVMMGIDSAKRDMREQTGALVAFNGQGDPMITTATGMSIARDSALALISTPLAISAEVDQEWCWQILKLTKEYWFDQKYKFLLGKYNESEADAFRECVLEEEINIFVEPGSWTPQTNDEKLRNLGAFLTAFGLELGFLNPTIPQPVRDYAAQLYNIPFDFNELAPDIRIAQKRLDLAKDVAAIQIPKALVMMPNLINAGRQEEAETLLQVTRTVISDAMGVEEDLDDHSVMAGEYKKWLKTDEGQNAHTILREAIKQTMLDHQAFLKTQMAEEMSMANAMMGGGGQPQQAGTFQPGPEEDNPFQAPAPNEGIKDYSMNSKNKKSAEQ